MSDGGELAPSRPAARVSASHASAGRPRSAMPKAALILPLGRVRLALLVRHVEIEVEDALVAAAQHGQRAVRGHVLDALRRSRNSRRTWRPPSSLPLTTLDVPARPRSTAIRAGCRPAPASSPMRSIRMSRAPSSAALASATPLSASTNLRGLGFRRPAPGSCSSASASGSRPASRAICALVRRLGL